MDTVELDPLVRYGENIEVKYQFGDRKQVDFLADIIKVYNLQIEPHPYIANHFIIEPRTPYYQQGNSQDWTYLVDRSKDIEVKHLSDVQSSNLYLSFNSDSDYLNEQYSAKYKDKIYGGSQVDIDNDWLTDKQANYLSTSYAATPLSEIPGTNIILPKLFKKDSDYQPEEFDYKPRLLYYKFIESNATSHWAGDENTHDYWDSYPYAGTIVNPYSTDPSTNFDLNFGIPSEIYFTVSAQTSTSGFTYTANNIRTEYWNDHIEEINDVNSRLVTLWVYLDSAKYYKTKLNDHIYIDNIEYKINRIIDYNSNKPGVTKVELIKSLNTFVNTFNRRNIPWTDRPHIISNHDRLSNNTLGNNNLIKGSDIIVGSKVNNSIVAGNNIYIKDNSEGSLFVGQSLTAQTKQGFIIGGSGHTINSGSLNGIIGGNDNRIEADILGTKNIIIGGNDNIIESGSTSNNLIVGGQANRIKQLAGNNSIINGKNITIDEELENIQVLGINNYQVKSADTTYVKSAVVTEFEIGEGGEAPTEPRVIITDDYGRLSHLPASAIAPPVSIPVGAYLWFSGSNINSIISTAKYNTTNHYSNQYNLLMGKYNRIDGTYSNHNAVISSRNSVIGYGGASYNTLLSSKYGYINNGKYNLGLGKNTNINNSNYSTNLNGFNGQINYSHHSLTHGNNNKIVGVASAVTNHNTTIGYNNRIYTSLSTQYGTNIISNNSFSIDSTNSGIFGGWINQLRNSVRSVVVGGRVNLISGCTDSVILGGSAVTIIGETGLTVVSRLRVLSATTSALTNVLFIAGNGDIYKGSLSSYASSSHTHSLSEITSTAHTHSISEITNLSSQLNTKLNLSGGTLTGSLTGINIFTSTLSANTLYSGTTNLSNLFVTSGQNLDAAVQVFKQKSGNLLQFRTIQGMGGTSVYTVGDTIRIQSISIPAGAYQWVQGNAYGSLYTTFGANYINSYSDFSIAVGKAQIITNSKYSSIIEGKSNIINVGGIGLYNTILNGTNSTIQGNYTRNITIIGDNINAYATSAAYSHNTLIGKNHNLRNGYCSSIFGGLSNTIQYSSKATIVGGVNNTIQGNAHYSAIIGGANYTLTDSYTVLVPKLKIANLPYNQTSYALCANASGQIYKTAFPYQYGQNNTASNLSGGIGLFSSKVGVDLKFRSLSGGSGIGITQQTNTVTITYTGSTSTTTTVNNGINTFTGGTSSFQSVNLTSATLSNLIVSGNTTLSGNSIVFGSPGCVISYQRPFTFSSNASTPHIANSNLDAGLSFSNSAITITGGLSGQSLSGTNIFSGTTNLNGVFEPIKTKYQHLLSQDYVFSGSTAIANHIYQMQAGSLYKVYLLGNTMCDNTGGVRLTLSGAGILNGLLKCNAGTGGISTTIRAVFSTGDTVNWSTGANTRTAIELDITVSCTTTSNLCIGYKPFTSGQFITAFTQNMFTVEKIN